MTLVNSTSTTSTRNTFRAYRTHAHYETRQQKSSRKGSFGRTPVAHVATSGKPVNDAHSKMTGSQKAQLATLMASIKAAA